MRTEGSTNLAPEVENIIRFHALKIPRINREELVIPLKYEIEREGFRAPSEDNLKRKISSARSSAPDTRDDPWCVSDIARPQCAVHPEALPAVLRVWAMTQVKTYLKDYPLTIREAQWVARLYYVFREAGLHDTDEERAEQLYLLLLETARQYALYERVFELAGEHPNKPEDMRRRWINDLHLVQISIGYAADAVDFKVEMYEKYGVRPYEKEASNEGPHSQQRQS